MLPPSPNADAVGIAVSTHKTRSPSVLHLYHILPRFFNIEYNAAASDDVWRRRYELVGVFYSPERTNERLIPSSNSERKPTTGILRAGRSCNPSAIIPLLSLQRRHIPREASLTCDVDLVQSAQIRNAGCTAHDDNDYLFPSTNPFSPSPSYTASLQ
ncbi:hypothetical protein BKA70DRAFT_1444052 [Coprinopsis sp. MPI-PUGE-AT-0042]|nr:hypothetical protein BKA70DRAFT_1444052 [Coprinopsis sp. MPI-PUGE-AT-0042]